MMSNHPGRVNRPYRKASEYLVASNNSTDGSNLQSNQENDVLNQKLILLTRKLERTEAEFAQSREYFENELHRFEDRQFKINEEYRKLQSSYVTLQSTNRELEQKLSKVDTLQREKNCLVREVNEINNKLLETRNALFKAQEENERLRKDCNLAVQLLKCNRSNYQVREPEQLPDEVHEQINSYKVELKNYNEYINPYASDSESDDERVKHAARSQTNRKSETQGTGTEIPVEFLAEALKKPENVHLNLEPSDYIQDPVLHSVYKAQYTDRKLIKPNYDQKMRGEPTSLRETNQARHPQLNNLPPAKAENSPWELAPSRQGVTQPSDCVDDESSAGAYGAYSVSSRRKIRSKPDRNDRPQAQLSTRTPAAYQDTKFAPIQLKRPPSLEDLSFRAPSEPVRSGISSYFNKSAKDGSGVSGSSGSSKKSTPVRVRGKEKATNAETSSLLNQSQSEDDDDGIMLEISHYPCKQTSPEKRYPREKGVVDEKGSLLAANSEEHYELPPPPSEIELEWDQEIELTENPPLDTLSSQNQVSKVNHQSGESQPNLLLSYSNVESPVKSVASEFESLMTTGAGKFEDESFLETKQYLPPPNPGGQLLSEIVINNPSLSNFLMSTAPPPPQEFASNSKQTTNVQVEIHPSMKSDHGLLTSGGAEFEPASLPVRVDDQIEVIDLDEEPRKRGNRRRNSFDQAREYGDVLNN